MRLTSQLSVFKQAQARGNAAKKTWATAAELMNDLVRADRPVIFHQRSHQLVGIQAIFCRRRHQPRRPPPAKIRPGRPAPTMGPGTGDTTCSFSETVAMTVSSCERTESAKNNKLV